MAPKLPISIPLFAQTQQQLLLKEHEAEVSSSALASKAASVSASTRRTLQATGYALTGIVLSQCRTGMGGRVVGEFTADPAISSNSKTAGEKTDPNGEPRLGAHGIRVGDVVRVSDISGGGSRKSGKDKDKDSAKSGAAQGVEGVVTRVGERSVWIAFGQPGSGGRPKEDDEGVEELWGKKLWLYVDLSALFMLVVMSMTMIMTDSLQRKIGERCYVQTVSRARASIQTVANSYQHEPNNAENGENDRVRIHIFHEDGFWLYFALFR